MNEKNKFSSLISILSGSVIAIVVLAFALTISNARLAKGTYGASTCTCPNGGQLGSGANSETCIKTCYSTESQCKSGGWTCTEQGNVVDGVYYYCTKAASCSDGASTSSPSVSSSDNSPSTGSDNITCAVEMSCNSTVVKNESINVDATVTVYKNGAVVNPGGTAYLSSVSWSVGGAGCAGGCGNNAASIKLSNRFTIDANSAVGQTINVSYTATLTNGKKCSGSKTITIIDCDGCAPSSNSGSEQPSNSSPSPASDSNPGSNSSPSPASDSNPGSSSGYVPKTSSTTVKPTNSSNVPVNPSTGTAGIIVAWIVGLSAIVYSFCYFKKNSSIK